MIIEKLIQTHHENLRRPVQYDWRDPNSIRRPRRDCPFQHGQSLGTTRVRTRCAKQSQSARARRPPLRIADWGLQIRRPGSLELRSKRRQTKPICTRAKPDAQRAIAPNEANVRALPARAEQAACAERTQSRRPGQARGTERHFDKRSQSGRARRLGLGIGDCRLGIRYATRPHRLSNRCQTKPMCSRARPEARKATLPNKPNHPRRQAGLDKSIAANEPNMPTVETHHGDAEDTEKDVNVYTE